MIECIESIAEPNQMVLPSCVTVVISINFVTTPSFRISKCIYIVGVQAAANCENTLCHEFPTRFPVLQEKQHSKSLKKTAPITTPKTPYTQVNPTLVSYKVLHGTGIPIYRMVCGLNKRKKLNPNKKNKVLCLSF